MGTNYYIITSQSDAQQSEQWPIHICKSSGGWPILWDLFGLEEAYNLSTPHKLEIVQRKDKNGANEVCFINTNFDDMMNVIGENEDLWFESEYHYEGQMDLPTLEDLLGVENMYSEKLPKSANDFPNSYGYHLCHDKKYWFILDPNWS